MRGLCDICGSEGSLSTCAICGARVCSACFDRRRGVCKRCLGGRTVG